jgi:apolipoprotein N-acyltransferase
VGSDGKVRAVYDKHHLVPFGEYVPFRHFMAKIGFEKLSHFRGSFDTGPGPATLHVKGMPPVGPLICYEVIFPREAVVPGDRPDWLVNITIDTWFGTTSGPYQHLAQARLRAVEQGLPLARSANNGVSAMIDPYGRLLDTLPLDTQGVIDARLPAALPPTLYARLGDGFVLFLGILLFLLSAWRSPSLKA